MAYWWSIWRSSTGTVSKAGVLQVICDGQQDKVDPLNKMVGVEAIWWWSYLKEVQGDTEASVRRLIKSFDVNSAIICAHSTFNIET